MFGVCSVLFYVFRQQCDHDGAELVAIDNQGDEYALHSFAVNNKQALWIGLQAQNVIHASQ